MTLVVLPALNSIHGDTVDLFHRLAKMSSAEGDHIDFISTFGERLCITPNTVIKLVRPYKPACRSSCAYSERQAVLCHGSTAKLPAG